MLYLFFQNTVTLIFVSVILIAKACNTRLEKNVGDKVKRRKSCIFWVPWVFFCNVTFFLRGNIVGRDQVPRYTVHVTDGRDEWADILSSWEPCRCRKRPQWAGAYRVKVFKNGQEDTAKHVRYRRHTHTHSYLQFL